MKHIKTFEGFLFEGYMSELDIIRQESKTLEEFIKKGKAAFPKIAKMHHADDFFKELWDMGQKMKESLNEKEFSEEEREKLAKSGAALPDGSFPIETVEDLKNAVSAYGRAKDQAAAAKHIAKRAKALGKEDLIPQTKDFQDNLK